MNKLIQNMLIAAIISLSSGAFTATALGRLDEKQKGDTDAAEYQKIINEYKNHLASVPPKVRSEIKEFRMSIAKLQKQKRDLYKKLSNEAQNYLNDEEIFRQKLPVNKPGQVDSQKKNAVNVKQSNTKS